MTSLLEILPAWPVLLPFALASLAVYAASGVDMTYIAMRSATLGRRAGIAAACGVAAGLPSGSR